MILLSGEINKNYGYSLDCFRTIRNKDDGISFFNFDIGLDLYKSDHTPRFNVYLVILNFKIFEFEIYYLHHRVRNMTGGIV